MARPTKYSVMTFTVEKRRKPIDDIVDAIRGLDARSQVRIATNGTTPGMVAILLHTRIGNGKLVTHQTGDHELCVWKR